MRSQTFLSAMCYSAEPKMVEWKCGDRVLCIWGAQRAASDELLSFFVIFWSLTSQDCSWDYQCLPGRADIEVSVFSLLEPVSMLKSSICALLHEWLRSLCRCYTCSCQAGWRQAGGLLPWSWRNKSICSKAPRSAYYQGKLESEEQNHDISASLGEDLYIQLINYSSVPFTPDSLAFVLFYTFVFVSPQLVSSLC